MNQAILNQIVEQLEALDLKELQQLNQVIQTHLGKSGFQQKEIALQETASQRTKFHQALLTSGLVKQLNQPSNTQQPERRLIQIQGQPISETILEERR
ncbi:MAG: hypothetical protein VKJ46_05280 [Leptolyngbyaceae bacterium]|nr:hypothetical protein [Leptolyngbyaceae bacterium]